MTHRYRCFINLFIVLPHAAISLFLVLHHEPWRDETHAFLLARGPATLVQLLADIQGGEISPPLWHLLLRIVASFTDNFLYVSLFHWAIAVTAVAVLVWYAPFRWVDKLLISLGYLLAFEYAVIARHYGLSVLLLFAVTALFKSGKDTRLAECLLLALLAQTNVFGTVLAAVMWLTITIVTRHRHYAGHLVVLLSLIVAGYYLRGDSALATLNMVVAEESPEPFTTAGYVAGTLLIHVFFQIPSFSCWHPSWVLGSWTAQVVLSIACGLAFFVLAPRRGTGGLFFWWSAALLVDLFMTMRNAAAVRHHGFLFVALVVGMWLGPSPLAPSSRPAGRRAPFALWIFRLFLAGSVWTTACAGWADVHCTYSQARQTAKNLLAQTDAQQGRKVLWAMMGSAECEGILAFLPRDRAEMYSLELGRPVRYLVHGAAWKAADRKGEMGYIERMVEQLMRELRNGGYQNAYVVVPTIPLQAQLSETLFLLPVTMDREDCVLATDERFYIDTLSVAVRNVPAPGADQVPAP